jgi:hypothetical protein
MMESPQVLQQQQERHAQPAVDVLLMLLYNAALDDDDMHILLQDPRTLHPLPLVKLAATTISRPLFISSMMITACATVSAGGKADWLVGVSADSHFVLQLDTQPEGADAAVQLLGYLQDRVVFACGTWLGTASTRKLAGKQPRSSLECQPHHLSIITHLITGIT